MNFMMHIYRSSDELRELLERLDTDNLYSPDELKSYRELNELENRVKETSAKFKINASFRMILSRADSYQDGSLCNSARVIDNDLMTVQDTPDAPEKVSVKSLTMRMESEDNAKVLDVLFSKFGLATVMIYDKERAKVIYPEIERAVLESSFEFVDYSAISDFEYTGQNRALKDYTWFERYFSDVFYK